MNFQTTLTIPSFSMVCVMVLSFSWNLTPCVLTATLMTTILVPHALNLNLKWTGFSSMNSLLAAFLVPKCIHPIGRLPKKDSGKSRPITNCSRPPGTSLNDYIKGDLESFRMNSIYTSMSMSTDNCFYDIVDIECAWRWVPIFPPHCELQGFCWMFGPHDPSRYKYFVDNQLCFGISCSPAILNRLSNAVVCMMA